MFAVTIGVYDSTGTYLASSYGSYTISLSTTTTISGTHSGDATAGEVTFSGLSIAAQGTYTLTATCGTLTVDSSPISISDSVTLQSIVATPSTSTPSVNFTYKISVELVGSDSNPFTTASDIAVSCSKSSVLFGDSSASTSTGYASLYIYFSTTGVFTLTFTSLSVSGTLTLTVVQQRLQFISMIPTVSFMQPVFSSDTFEAIVGVYDSTKQYLEELRGPYMISLTLSTGTATSVTSNAVTTNGIAVIAGLHGPSAGTCTLTASATNIASATSTVVFDDTVY